MKNQIEQNNLLKNRIVPGIIMGIIFILVYTMAIVGGNTSGTFAVSLRIITFVISGLVFLWMVFELFETFMQDWLFSGAFAILGGSILIFPTDTLLNYINDSISINEKISQIAYEVFTDYYSIIAILVLAVLYVIQRAIFISNLNIKNVLIKAFIIVVIFYLLQTSFKLLVYSTKFDWRYSFVFIVTAVASDMTGFFAGKYFGKKFIKRGFSPAYSPNKTWEGAIGSFFISFVLIIVYVFSFGLYESAQTPLTIILITLPFFPIAGDLIFSILKRLNGTKDYSRIFKGHGGFLDRFDSISFISFFGFLFLLTGI